MIAPDHVTLDDVDGHSSAIAGEVSGRPGGKADEAIRSCSGTGHQHHPLSGQAP